MLSISEYLVGSRLLTPLLEVAVIASPTGDLDRTVVH